jgi:hypothetical protein
LVWGFILQLVPSMVLALSRLVSGEGTASGTGAAIGQQKLI